MQLLARREHSRAELARKLSTHAASAEALESLLDDLTRLGLLSDERAAQSYVRSHAGRFGPARLAGELRQRGFAGVLVEQVVKEATADESEVARAVWQRKFGKPPIDARDKARQVRFLQGRGFAIEVILRVLRSM